MVQPRHVSGKSKHTPPVSTGGVYYVPMTTEQTPDTDAPEVEVTGYGYLTDAEREAAIKDHAAAVKKSKG